MPHTLWVSRVQVITLVPLSQKLILVAVYCGDLGDETIGRRTPIVEHIAINTYKFARD